MPANPSGYSEGFSAHHCASGVTRHTRLKRPTCTSLPQTFVCAERVTVAVRPSACVISRDGVRSRARELSRAAGFRHV